MTDTIEEIVFHPSIPPRPFPSARLCPIREIPTRRLRWHLLTLGATATGRIGVRRPGPTWPRCIEACRRGRAPLIAYVVDCDWLLQALQDLQLVGLVQLGDAAFGLLLGHRLAPQLVVLADDLVHLLADLFQVLLGERLGHCEVVVEPALDPAGKKEEEEEATGAVTQEHLVLSFQNIRTLLDTTLDKGMKIGMNIRTRPLPFSIESCVQSHPCTR